VLDPLTVASLAEQKEAWEQRVGVVAEALPAVEMPPAVKTSETPPAVKKLPVTEKLNTGGILANLKLPKLGKLPTVPISEDETVAKDVGNIVGLITGVGAAMALGLDIASLDLDLLALGVGVGAAVVAEVCITPCIMAPHPSIL